MNEQSNLISIKPKDVYNLNLQSKKSKEVSK